MEHKHLIVRAEITNPPVPSETVFDVLDLEKDIENWLRDLVDKIGMFVLCDPKAVYCYDPDNRGMTACVILTTSHCVLHTFDHTEIATLQFDLYSCAAFDVQQVIKLLDRFGPTKIEYKFLDREHGLTLIE